MILPEANVLSSISNIRKALNRMNLANQTRQLTLIWDESEEKSR